MRRTAMGFEAFYRMIRRSFAAIGAFGLVAGGAASAEAQVACEAMKDFSAPDVRITAADAGRPRRSRSARSTASSARKSTSRCGCPDHLERQVRHGRSGRLRRPRRQPGDGMGALEKGYAVAGTDTGHVGPGGATDGALGARQHRAHRQLRPCRLHRVTETARRPSGALRPRRGEGVLRRLLERRTPGPDVGPALPGGLRRDPRRRAGAGHSRCHRDLHDDHARDLSGSGAGAHADAFDRRIAGFAESGHGHV